MRVGRWLTFVAASAALWLAGIGVASADTSAPPTPAAALSTAAPAPSTSTSPSSAASPTSGPSTSAPSTSTAPTNTPPSTTPPASGTSSPTADPPSGLTATFNRLCTNYGWDVTNPTTSAHTVHAEVNGTQVGGAVAVAAGATAHVPLPTDNTIQGGDQVRLLDETGSVVDSFVATPAGCTTVKNIHATIHANATFTLSGFRALTATAPNPRHGTVAAVTVNSTTTGAGLRYTPDRCFAGTDSFGYDASLDGQQGVVTVTVLAGPCPTSSAGSSPAPGTPGAGGSLASTGTPTAQLAGLGAVAVALGALIIAFARPRRVKTPRP